MTRSPSGAGPPAHDAPFWPPTIAPLDPADPQRGLTWFTPEHDNRGIANRYEHAPEYPAGVASSLHESHRTEQSHAATHSPKRIRYGNAFPRPIHSDLAKTSRRLEFLFKCGEGQVDSSIPKF